MARAHLSFRVDEAVAERADAQALAGESKAATYGRIFEAGLEALESPPGSQPHRDMPAGDGEQPAVGTSPEAQALAAALNALTTQLKSKDEQLAAAMEHNAQLTEALAREQETAQAALTLQGMEQAKRLEDSTGDEKKRPGLWRRLFGKWSTDGEEKD